jgi:NADP-dependent 3-hydroxy acid dehydrogenase YdfG
VIVNRKLTATTTTPHPALKQHREYHRSDRTTATIATFPVPIPILFSMAQPLLKRAGILGRIFPTWPRAQTRSLMTLPSFSLEGKTCVVTGAARGLGKEFLTAFARSGAKGACVDISLESGRATVAQIKDYVAEAESTSVVPELSAYACDVTSESQVRDTWSQIVSDFRKVDVVVTAAGIVDNVEAENYGYERWRKMFDINVHGSFLFAREAGKYWIREGIRGNLILVSSMSAKICVRPQKQAAYNAVSEFQSQISIIAHYPFWCH